MEKNIPITHTYPIPNTFGIRTYCRRYVETADVKQLSELFSRLCDDDLPLLVVGSGSNLLFTDDYPGTVLHVALRDIQLVSDDPQSVKVRVGAGVVFDDWVEFAIRHGWYGAENLSLIPGEVGASAVQNIGAYGAEVKDLIDQVETIEVSTGKKHVFTREECHYGYRYSRFKGEWKGRMVVTHVTFVLSKTFTPKLDYGHIREELAASGIQQPTAQELRDVIIRIRQSKLPDPKVEGNAGSFFMNPVVERDCFNRLKAQYPAMPHYEVDGGHVKIPAGWMIEQCGWKGKSMGRAGVHDKQALVLVNRGGATGAEVLALCEQVRADVKEKFGVDIHPEVNIF